MSKPRSLSAIEVVNFLKRLRMPIDVKSDFHGQVGQVDDLLKNDKTGIVTPTIDFMVSSATVPFHVETKNENLNSFLSDWQDNILNRDINIDIPSGLRELSVQYYKERLRSSMIALRVTWGEADFGANGKFIVPKKMWLLNGKAITVEESEVLNRKEYFLHLKNGDPKRLRNQGNESIFIRKPYGSWYENYPVPYLVRRGALFNALLKNALVQKQSDLIESIVPYLLQIQAGNDAIVQYMPELLPSEEGMTKLKEKIIDSKEKWEETRGLRELIATLRHDVKLEHLIPDLTKFLNKTIVEPIDRNLLSSLGYIELQGFSSTRQEAILNPKVLIEEVKDSVLDWAGLLEDVMKEMMFRNKDNHRNLGNNKIDVIPGVIKSFITDDMRSMMRSLYDRGVISKQNVLEDLTDLQFEVQVDRRTRENKRDIQKIMEPPVIQNLEQHPNLDLEDQDKKPNTPESDNFNQAVIEGYLKSKKQEKGKTEQVISYETIDDLPKEVKNELPVAGQIIWLKSYNTFADKTNNKEDSEKHAWKEVSVKYKKIKDKKKWVKK